MSHTPNTRQDVAISPSQRGELIPLKSLVGVIANTYDSTRMKVNRYSITKSYSSSETGKICMVSPLELKDKGLIDEKQFLDLMELTHPSLEKRGQLIDAKILDTDKLFCSDSVQKGFCFDSAQHDKCMTATEIEVLNRVCPGWMRMKKGDIIARIIEVCGVTRSWLYRDHRLDLRTVKEKAFERMSSLQREQVSKYKLIAKTNVHFIKKCMSDETLPRLSERTWYRIANYLNTELQDELMLVNEGAIKLRQSTEPILRDKTYLQPLQVIVGDFTRIDRIIKWHDGTLCTPYLCVWLDWRTNMIVGAAITKHPNALGVKTSLFNCFANYGVCGMAFMDNGKEFKGFIVVGDKMETVNYRIDFTDDVERTIKDFEYRGLLPAMGVQWMRAIVKNPRSKPVERAFGRGGFTDWAKGFGDWVGSKYWERPETIAKAIAKYEQGKAFIEPLSGEILYFSDLYSLAATVNEFINYHNNRPSEGFGMDGKSPQELWNELVLETPPRRANVNELAFHFMDGDTRKVRNTSHIEFKKHFFYRSDALWNHRLERVYIRYNPVDGFWWNRGDKKQFEFLPKSLLVFDIDGKYICEASFVERQEPLGADVKALMGKQRETAREAKENVKHLLRDNTPLNPSLEGNTKSLLASSTPSVPPVELVEAFKEAEELTMVNDEKAVACEQKRLQKKFGLVREL